MQSRAQELTQLLESWSRGDQSAMDKLIPLVYDDLHRLAHRYMADERPEHTLQTTALVNEAYMRLVDAAHASPENRIHFFAACSRAMRQILVDWARGRQALKRGADVRPLEFKEPLAVVDSRTDFIALDDALQTLAAIDPRKSHIVELRFFGGLTGKEAAEILSVSEETVQRDWKLAKSWLRRELTGKNPHEA